MAGHCLPDRALKNEDGSFFPEVGVPLKGYMYNVYVYIYIYMYRV